ncbi:MAG: serpin family protein, partial [Candidatus Limnocylindria bacterium]|nr:serpin family protein [Candidatus Limnocylindria bacterium]
SKAQLKDALGELGMPVAFTDRADFSGLTKQEPLEIADVIHEAFIAVDENGTEAAAATAVVMRATSAPAKRVELVIDQTTRLVLTNAIYLKAAWLTRFRDAVPGIFHRADGSDVQAKLMSQSANLPYGAGDGYQAVRLPYVGGLSMVAIVPEPAKLSSFERGLDGAALRRIVTGLIGTQVILSMPTFSFRSKAQLKDALGELGMPVAFTDRADFSGMTKQEPLKIADVIHQAFIAVDENGTEAAAATGVVMGATSAPLKQVELKIDRPFLFLIQDDETGAILFIGRVADPTR